ncbi:MAG: hypothetical protein LKJ44_04460 [Bifidobacteriaceae bacterium]|nr:hypothetical protein [Bifidobacteriaceae bacterium]MCI1978951.1 hypothetical protein [Bifidobacteriaceae bacterium]
MTAAAMQTAPTHNNHPASLSVQRWLWKSPHARGTREKSIKKPDRNSAMAKFSSAMFTCPGSKV